jgi:hypothetical protein
MEVRLSALRTDRTLLPQEHYYFSISGTHFCQRLSKPPEPRAAGRIK